VSQAIEQRAIHPSFFRFFPRVDRYYRYLLPLMPWAAHWSLPPCDLVISLSHCVAKSAQPPPGVPHLCYCFTPMRYAWHMRTAYFKDSRRGLVARLREGMLARLRDWDRRTADRVSHFVAISHTVRRRVAECYGRESRVIYPPVDTDFYTPGPGPSEDYYLVVSAFAPYKRIDLAVEACARSGRRLVVIGTGQDDAKLRRLGGGSVEFLGWQPDEAIREKLRECRALLFPGEEDFGIVPVEAQACGTPVIAFGRGGASETILTGAEPTGFLFEEQSVDCLVAALEEFEKNSERYAPQTARRQALRFNKQRFAQQLIGYAEELMRPAKQKPMAA
jgi:glycosyltransferase involved in cell wall biosynthesis